MHPFLTGLIFATLLVSGQAELQEPPQNQNLSSGAQALVQQRSPARDRYIIHLKSASLNSVGTATQPPIGLEDASEQVSRMGGWAISHLQSINAIVAQLPLATLETLRNATNWVELIEPDYVRYLQEQTVPYGIPQIQDFRIRRDGVSPAQARPIVCIVDTGYDITHPDLPHMDVTYSNVSNITNALTDNIMHGTHVAGIITALDNDIGVVGASAARVPKLHISKVFPDKEAGFTHSSLVMEGVEKCVEEGHANIVTMSLGGSEHSEAERKLFSKYYHAGVLFVAAAGNDGIDTRSYPASYPGVISVAAVDGANQHASFSTYNDKVELAAPGYKVLSTVPVNKGSYKQLSGTSMAAPYVTGAAAVVWSLRPACTNVQVREALQRSALHLGTGRGRNSKFGFGLVQVLEAAQDLERHC